MPKVAVLNNKAEKIKDIKLSDEIFGVEPNDQTIYDAVVLKMAADRQGTHKVKTRSEVSGGGRVFGPTTERNYTKKQNKKERRLALKSALTYKAIDKEIFVVENFDAKSNKTKDFKNTLETLKLEGKTLIVVKELTDNLILGSRNLRDVKVIETHEINTFDVINYKNLVITEEAVKMLEEVLK